MPNLPWRRGCAGSRWRYCLVGEIHGHREQIADLMRALILENAREPLRHSELALYDAGSGFGIGHLHRL